MSERLLKQKGLSVGAAAPLVSGVLQRKCGACGNHTVSGGKCQECKQKNNGVLRRPADGCGVVNEVPQIVYDVLHSSGQPLDKETRAFFEPRFSRDFSQAREQRVMPKSAQAGLRIGSADDHFEHEADRIAARVIQLPMASGLNRAGSQARHDFSQVRVHADAKAAESARAVGALAYTVGRDVVFGGGQYAPETTAGRQLLAHELAHTVQQTDSMSGLLIQRMAPCPSSPHPLPSGWKPYHGDPCVFHCCYEGILEDRRPTPDDPQNECFYDNRGNLVDQHHPYAGCGGTPNQYDSATDPVRHALIDRGGIVRSGLGAFLTSRRHDFKPAECLSRCSGVPGVGKFFCFQQCMSAE